jgi:hypothetical protein
MTHGTADPCRDIGHDVPAGATFCIRCGQPQAAVGATQRLNTGETQRLGAVPGSAAYRVVGSYTATGSINWHFPPASGTAYIVAPGTARVLFTGTANDADLQRVRDEIEDFFATWHPPIQGSV